MLKALKVKPKDQGETWGQYYQKNSLPFGVFLFVGGFIFDIFTVSEIEDSLGIAQQIFYLLAIGWILYYEIVAAASDWKPSGLTERLWNVREGFSHFCLGSLLNIYSIYYFKSSSLSSSIYFIAFLAILLVLNEIPAIQSRGPIVRLSIWSLCLSSFFVSVIPLILSQVNRISFVLSVTASAAVIFLFLKLLQGRRDIQVRRVNLLMLASTATLGLYTVAYLLKLVPPVPLALKEIGIYHHVQKVEGSDWILTEEKPWWRFWHKGDQYFVAKPGDKVFVYAAIHAPSNITKNQILIKWLYKDRKGNWQPSEAPKSVDLSGGRKGGFRTFFSKANYFSGDWRVSIETPEGLEIGRIGLTIEKNEVAPTDSNTL